MKALPHGPSIKVTRIEVVGNRVVKDPPLARLVADAAGKSLSLQELEEIAQRITRYYREQGYFVARAYVPAQEVTDGLVKIRVVEGNYGEFHLKNRSRVRDRIVQGMLDDVKSADIVSTDTLERAMLIINDTPGVKVTRADVMPGQKVGTSDFSVETAAAPAYDGFAMYDNYGSRYTGTNRLSFNVDLNSPTGSGDRLSVSGLATDHADLLNGRIGYSAPLAANGLRGELAVSQTGYELGDTFASLDAVGHATTVDGILTYPLRRTERQTIGLSFDLAYKSLVDEINSTETRNRRSSIAATLAANVRDERRVLGLGGLTQASLGLTAGSLTFRDSQAEALDSQGADTAGAYQKAVATVSRASLLPQRFVLTTSVLGQYALHHKSLDGSERMAVSGYSAVAAYSPEELIGDSAVYVRADLSRPVPLPIAQLQASWDVFTDYGEAWSSYSTADVAGQRHLTDVGLGLSGKYRGAMLRASLAHRLSGAPLSEPEPHTKVLIQAGWVF